MNLNEAVDVIEWKILQECRPMSHASKKTESWK